MPGPFWRRPPRDEQPLGIAVRQIDCDRALDKLRQVRPRTGQVWLSINHWLDRRNTVRAATERPWCGAPRDLGGQQPCPLAEPCDISTCRIGRAAGDEVYRSEPPGGEGGSRQPGVTRPYLSGSEGGAS